MGLFDFFMSEEKLLKKHIRTLTNRDAQPEDRDAAARWLANNASPTAILGLLSRFDLKLDHQMKDQGEKDQVYALAVGLGSKTIEPLRAWLKQCKLLAQPLALLQEVAGMEATLLTVAELLEAEFKKDDFKTEKKKGLLIWVTEHAQKGARDARLVPAIAPFLKDFDENVRCLAAEALAVQEDERVPALLVASLANPEEDSNRLRTRLADVVSSRRWSLGEAAERVAARPVSGYAVRDGRLVSA